MSKLPIALVLLALLPSSILGLDCTSEDYKKLKNMLPESLCPMIHVFYNAAFKAYAKKEHPDEMPADVIRGYIKTVNEKYFSHASLQTKIDFKIEGMHDQDEAVWDPRKRTVNTESLVSGKTGSQFLFFTESAGSEDWRSFPGLRDRTTLPFSIFSVCETDPAKKITVINVAKKKKEQVELEVTRCLAFALGMDADYLYNYGGHEVEDNERPSEICGPSCNELSGVMDIFKMKVDGWTLCSVSDLVKYYKEHTKDDKRFCIDSCPVKRKTTTTMTTTTTCTTTTTKCIIWLCGYGYVEVQYEWICYTHEYLRSISHRVGTFFNWQADHTENENENGQIPAALLEVETDYGMETDDQRQWSNWHHNNNPDWENEHDKNDDGHDSNGNGNGRNPGLLVKTDYGLGSDKQRHWSRRDHDSNDDQENEHDKNDDGHDSNGNGNWLNPGGWKADWKPNAME